MDVLMKSSFQTEFFSECQKSPLVIIALSDLSKALLSLLNLIGCTCTSRGAVFVVYKTNSNKKQTTFLLLLSVNKWNIFLTDIFSF